MLTKAQTGITAALLAIVLFSNTGCMHITAGPDFPIPIPVTPYWQDRLEDRAWVKERYERAPILGPLTAGSPVKALDEPSDDEVMRAFERADRIEGGIPLLWEAQRNNVQITKEKIADYIDPPRVVPLIGPVQLHHAHYKCTIYYSQKTRVGWPFPHTVVDEDAREVVYIDHNHFHMVGNVQTD
ncbi:MAG: hypothetical protein KDA42_19935 [Planctomycetales bacterium]|nr:hypothetical protein [Planctomycetales bacterium]